jgi:hypothetical protein
MNHMVTRAELIALLKEWQAGRISATEVHEWAEARYVPGDFEVDDDDDSGSAATEVLAQLDLLDINLITAEDIPHYLELLHSPKGAFGEALRRFKAQQAVIDFHARRHALAATEPYGRAQNASSITDVDQEQVVRLLVRDLRATVGAGHDDLALNNAIRLRQFIEDVASYIQEVVDATQQDMHDEFVDTVWPRCPLHAHPLWFRDGSWWCERDDRCVARLGELESA